MVKRLLDKRANKKRMGFAAAFLLLLSSLVLTFISNQKMIGQTEIINRTNYILHTLQKSVLAAGKSESALKNYFITNDSSSIRDCMVYRAEAKEALGKADSLFASNPVQQKNLDDLKRLVFSRINLEDSLLRVFSEKGNGNAEIKPLVVRGTALMKEIEEQSIRMQDYEDHVWKMRSENVANYSKIISVLDVISVFLAVALTFYSLIVYNKENADKKIESEKAKIFRMELENRVKQLAELNKELINLRGLEKYAVTGRIARTIAHEVRNPLTNINLSIEQLQSESEKDDSSKIFFDMIKRNSDRINNLVNDLLSATRVDDLNFSKVSINDVIDESLLLATDRIQLKKIQIIKNFDPEICEISVDREKVKIAILNIIVNAIEAMKEGGQLEISTESAHEKCVIKISDNGEGMDKAHMDRLFEPYFTTKEKGNGLGLANSQNIILGHGGSIWVESEREKGTTFTITFNIA